ncbi:hypothetical protein EHS43_10500 [Streptomyces sp. RP5T]|nr:hypothetical protein EHS43_10500 [Streptomyces sp. RP5T]
MIARYFHFSSAPARLRGGARSGPDPHCRSRRPWSSRPAFPRGVSARLRISHPHHMVVMGHTVLDQQRESNREARPATAGAPHTHRRTGQPTWSR